MATVQIKVPRNVILKGKFEVNATWTHRVEIKSRMEAVPGETVVFSGSLASGPGGAVSSQNFTIPASTIPSNRFLILDFKFQKDGQWYDSHVGTPSGDENNKPIKIEAKDSFPDADMDAKITIGW
jgi:predicted outer membrane repeat protein